MELAFGGRAWRMFQVERRTSVMALRWGKTEWVRGTDIRPGWRQVDLPGLNIANSILSRSEKHCRRNRLLTRSFQIQQRKWKNFFLSDSDCSLQYCPCSRKGSWSNALFSFFSFSTFTDGWAYCINTWLKLPIPGHFIYLEASVTY